MNHQKKALLLIECQNEWLSPSGKLNRLMLDRPQFDNSVINITKALAHARKEGIQVIHSGLRFREDYAELKNGRSGLRKAIQGARTFHPSTNGSQFYKDHAPLKNEFVPEGRIGASAFTGSNLDLFLRNNEIDEIFITGYALHVCVESTLRDAHERGYHTAVISDASSAFTATQRDHVINDVVHHFGHHLTTEQFLNQSK